MIEKDLNTAKGAAHFPPITGARIKTQMPEGFSSLDDSTVSEALRPADLNGTVGRLLGSGVVAEYTGPTSDELQRMLNSGDPAEQQQALYQLYLAFAPIDRTEAPNGTHRDQALCLLIFGEKEVPEWFVQLLNRMEQMPSVKSSLPVQEALQKARQVLPPQLPRSV